MKGAAIVVMMIVVGMIQFMAKPGEAITCGQVDSSLAPCMTYLTGGGNPSPACCDGAKNLKALTPTTADRQAACNCVKDAAGRYPNIKDDAATALPQKCGVQINIPISRNTNCGSIS